MGSKKDTGERNGEICETEGEGEVVVKGGHPWHGAVVCPGTTMGRWYTCFQSGPCGSTGRLSSLSHTQRRCHAYILILHP